MPKRRTGIAGVLGDVGKGAKKVRARPRTPPNTVRRGRGPTAGQVVQPRVTQKAKPQPSTQRRGRGPRADKTEQPVLVQTGGGRLVALPRKRYERLVREQRRQGALRLAGARRQGYGSIGGQNRANQAKPKPADFKVAGLNVDRLTGKAGRAAIDVLEETTRPIHGIAGGTRAAIRGENVREATVRGLANEDRYTFSDVLREAGVKGTAASVAGFGLDVALDPTTYATFGTASVARSAATKAGAKRVLAREAQRKSGKLANVAVKPTGASEKASRKAYRRARADGLSEAEARRLADKAATSRSVARQQRRTRTLDSRSARRAERRVERSTPDSTGLKVGFGTANVVVPAGKSLRTEPTRVSRTLREIGTTFSPHIRPSGVSRSEFRAVKASTREARAQASRGREHAIARAAAFAKAIPPERASEVIDAIERGTVYDLRDKTIRDAATAIRSELRAARRAELKAGVGTGHLSNARYFSHMLEDALDAAKGGKAGTTIRASYGKTRKHRGTIAQIEARGGPKFSKDIPTVIARRLSQSAQDVAKARLAEAVGKAGRPVAEGVQVKTGETVFEVAAGKVRALDMGDAADRRLLDRVASGASDKKLVVLNREFVEREVKGAAPGEQRNIVGRGFDKVTGGFKYLSTVPNPGFHLRNLYGDTQNAYLAQGGGRLAKNTVVAGRTLKALHRSEEAARTVGFKRALGATTKIRDRYGRTQTVSLEQLAREASNAGAIRQGFIERELPELWRANAAGVKKVKKGGKLTRYAGRVIQSREDLMRLATYIGARKEGLGATEAADRVARHHFDYGDLSPFERGVMRRLLPFYTFTARNVPLQTKSVVERPGKFANVQKAREEIAKAQGIDLAEFEGDLREFQLRAVPVPLKLNGEVYAVSTALPLGDLNELPVPRDGDFALKNLDEWKNKFTSMLNPLIRTPVELSANYNYFFRGPIERDESPLVAAPAFVEGLPDPWKRKLGVVSDYVDRRTGEKTWGWPAKIDYISKVLAPGPPGAIMRLSEEGESRRGQGTKAKALSYFGGVRADRVDPETAQIDLLFALRSQLLKRRAMLSQRGQGSADYGRRETREYVRVHNDIKRVEAHIQALSKKRGDKRPLLERARRRSDPLGLGGSGGGNGDPLGLEEKTTDSDPLGLL